MTDDFSHYPTSISERRGMESREPASWTPKDALIKVLRDIDGKVYNAEHVIIIVEAEGRQIFCQAGRLEPLAQLGLLEYGKKLMEGN